jgi:hypothetical protein
MYEVQSILGYSMNDVSDILPRRLWIGLDYRELTPWAPFRRLVRPINPGSSSGEAAPHGRVFRRKLRTAREY